MRNLQGHGLRLVHCASTEEAVQGADIVTSATANKQRAAIFQPQWVHPGLHLNALGGDCPGKTELHPLVLQGASLFVEYEPQTRIEGEIQQMPATFAVTPLWQVLAGQHPGRRTDTEVTIFDSVGFALEDFSALHYMRDAALALGLGSPLDLVPRLADPRDLFGVIGAAGGPP